jgi:hypothetical protein
VAGDKVVLIHKSTGERIERWPVDARGMIEHGDYTADTPTGQLVPAAPVAPVPDPVPHVAAAAAKATELSPTGAPLVVSKPEDVSPAAPLKMPKPGERKPGKKR